MMQVESGRENRQQAGDEGGWTSESKPHPLWFCLPPSRSGQALTEFALALPMLLLVLLGAIDLGRAYSAYVTITNASREGARAAAAGVPGSATWISAIQNRAIQEANNSGITLTASNITVTCAPVDESSGFNLGHCSAMSIGDPIRVTITYNFNFITTYIFGIGSVPISDYTVMAASRIL
ncbi:MAG: pilus assembly protein [Chloroflexi bacterium]|nr:pilus assembly protein [Chloroflexota bacterium]